ncbi:nagb/rpia/CoA transferase-like protein [Xylona heveae TC161]|uniref:Translation initiation factor eIF2B subunit alpha n=1 Tax=Xylona heveae (strain CBS 132557 / TC161) TaxID=1328760 RepID=A0A165HA68_XYLHT|nr:nagb/rpia/CoA transferase-like protein [Xylona heveae TC161]KZF23201.1 nagb/rpia/CoA transferase-like protein [Xylona heveae TC161]
MAAAQKSSTKPSSKDDFDIVETYQRLLREDPDLTMPVAAIESLVELLSRSDARTISETLDLLAISTLHLKRSIPNPISLSAGTDLFQRYLITTLQRPGQLGPAGDFGAIRAHLLSNGRLFVQRAKASREKIASFGRHFVRDGATVLTNGGSRVVGALLKSAAESSAASLRFRVIYVLSSQTSSASNGIQRVETKEEGLATVAALRAKGVPVATIPESAVGYSLGKVDMVIVGAEGVVENGGIISRLGTYQIGLLAKAAGKPFYVVAESHKFVRLYPLSQYDLPIEQRVIDFKTTADTEKDKGTASDGVPDASSPETKQAYASTVDDAVDYTPPDLISALITESGVLTPSAVSEELIKIWF